MYSMIKISILLILSVNEFNCRPFYCDLLFNKTNGQFDGIQVFSLWFPVNQTKLGVTHKMYKNSLGKEWEFRIEFSKELKAIDLEFIENSVKSLEIIEALNRFSFTQLNGSLVMAYKCFSLKQVLIYLLKK